MWALARAADMLAGFARQRVEEKVVRGNTEIENKLLDNLTANCQITMARYSKEKLIELKAKWADIRELLVSEESMDEAND